MRYCINCHAQLSEDDSFCKKCGTKVEDAANLSADYLAGGSLSGAKYDVTWYKQSTTFSTSEPAAKGYSFDTGSYHDRYYYSNDSGNLGVDGTASITCDSEKITDGSPYIYHRYSTCLTLQHS